MSKYLIMFALNVHLKLYMNVIKKNYLVNAKTRLNFNYRYINKLKKCLLEEESESESSN